MSLKSRFIANSLSIFLILAEFLSAGCTYLIKCYLKHLSPFGMLLKFYLQDLILLAIQFSCYHLGVCISKRFFVPSLNQ